MQPRLPPGLEVIAESAAESTSDEHPGYSLGASILIRVPAEGKSNAAEAAMKAFELRQQIESLGDVIGVTRLQEPGTGSILIVRYKDFEAATRAVSSPDLCCTLVSPAGLERPPGIHIEPNKASDEKVSGGASDTSTEPESDKGVVCKERLTGGVAPHAVMDRYGLVELQSSSNSSRTRLPRRAAAQTKSRQSVRAIDESEVCWKDLADHSEERTKLCLRGLPRRLVEPGALEEFLNSHGLAGAVSRIRRLPLRSSGLGLVMLEVSSPSKVSDVAKFFHGRVFGTTMPVAVSFANAPRSGLFMRGSSTPM